MVVGEPNINNIMGGIENTGSVRLHNHRKKLKQRFDIIKKLGQGTYGKVQLGINKETGQEVAIKTIKKSKIETEADLVRIRREIQIMSSVQHPNIIHIYEVFENREKMVLVMEYAAGGELYDYLSERKVLSEEEARRIFRQISTACYYCHKHKICHRDLKLENILLDERGNAKIADFGLSNVFDDQRLLSTFCGSPLYASPEIVKGTPYQGPEVDCWSLGVLLYTLVYGAMPFDGSNFKRLVRQISQGDYFEPKKPSRASPLIRDMLTVNPRNRANIEKICAHWWVNECYDECCLEISEELANQTPVRLDLLLSLAPPAPQLESEKLVVTGDATTESGINSESVPTRSQSVGSIMEFANPAERRINDLLSEDVKVSPKRKLEATASTDQIYLTKEGGKRKEKTIKVNTIADMTLHAPIEENSLEDESMVELNKSATQVLSREMDIEQTEEYIDPSTQGAACTEIIEDAKKIEKKIKNISSPTTPITNDKVSEPTDENSNTVDKENIKEINNEKKIEDKPEEKQKQEQSKIPSKRKVIKKKVLTDKNEQAQAVEKPVEKNNVESNEPKIENKVEDDTPVQPPSKPVERRRSRIFETAEKFQNMISGNESKSTVAEKPKKIVIPGVSVGGYKKEFERKASLTMPSKISLTKKPSVDKEEPEKIETIDRPKAEVKSTLVQDEQSAGSDRRTQVQNAVNIITNALDKDGTRKSKSRPCMIRKPPVPFGLSGRSASGGISTLPLSPPTPLAEEIVSPSVHGSKPAQVVEESNNEIPEENKTSSAEITLKSATLPRRKTTKAEIKLDYPAPKQSTMGFKTEMAHRVEGAPKLSTQRSEVTFPVSSPTIDNYRSASVEPENKVKHAPKERIIPISFERDPENRKEHVTSPPAKPPLTKLFNTQRSNLSQRSNSLSRQSTQESDSETTTSTGEPIRKSPREYIIPIAVEGGGYVTPRAGSLEPSETGSTLSNMTSKSKFGRNRKLNDREGSEDESPFAALHRHCSFGRDSDTEDPVRDMFRMHSLRSSRPRKAALEHNDSFSSGEEDDDDGFEILTAENLFSTLLSRVRDLTQRLNVDGRPGFPSSRLLSSHFDRGSNFWNTHNRPDSLSRFAPIGRTTSREPSVESSASSRSMGAPWRRSVSRDLASDIESVFKGPVQPPPTHTATLPRGDSNRENLNLTDLDLKKLKLSDEDALALSFLTPGLSRRIQKQLLAQLAPSEARKLSRTLSLRTATETKPVDEIKSENNTYLRRLSVESGPARFNKNMEPSTSYDINKTYEEPAKLKSNLPIIASPNRSTKQIEHQKPLQNHSSDVSTNHTRRLRTSSSVGPRFGYLIPRHDNCSSLPSPDSSTADSLSSLSGSSRLSKYLSGNSDNDKSRCDLRQPSPARRASRFLRSDFYDSPKDSNYYLKEKKERELETQKILKEIRDKRKTRFRERSASKERSKMNVDGDDNQNMIESNDNHEMVKSDETDNLLKNVSDNIRNLESNVSELSNHNYVNVENLQTIPDYVNVPQQCPKVMIEPPAPPVIKKDRISKIARPKSYPAENNRHIKVSPEIEPLKSKIGKLKKPEKVKESEKTSNKNKFLQTIEKKFEKLRSFSNSPTSVSSEDAKKKSMVEDTIKRLREQSLPRNAENCSTESGLIKRAVSVEDLTDPKQLQASRKSVTKILNLFKKYEEKGGKKGEKVAKIKKTKEESKKITKNKNGQLYLEKTDNHDIGAVDVIYNRNNNDHVQNDVNLENSKNKTEMAQERKLERPRSLLLDKSKQFQPACNGAKNDATTINNDKDVKRVSKLPVTSYRRSLNLDNQLDPPMFYKSSQTKAMDDSKLPEPSPSTSIVSPGFQDDTLFLSPGEDNDASLDSWSICSDYHSQDLTSPVSPCGHFYSADENESVSDRIRRKSFYTRFNEKKRPRKTNLGNYRDLDLYKDMTNRKPTYRNYNYSSLDRKSLDRKSCYNDVNPEYSTNDYKDHSALFNDDYDDLPNRYHTYNPRDCRRSSSVYDLDSEEANTLDDASAAGKNRLHSYYNQPSRHSNSRYSPIRRHTPIPIESSLVNETALDASTSLNNL